jgi:hypothetical protein
MNWNFNKYSIDCDIPILKTEETEHTIGAATSTSMAMWNSIIPYSDDNHLYICNINPNPGKFPANADSAVYGRQIAYAMKFVSFKNQGRQCGEVSFAIDYVSNGNRVQRPGSRGYFCIAGRESLPAYESMMGRR